MNTSYDAVRAALSQFTKLLPDWLKLVQGRRERENEIKSREGFVLELKELRTIRKPEPWQKERLKLLEQGADFDKERLAELYEERRQQTELTERLIEAEHALFRFGDERGIDTEPLRRLLMDGDLERAGVVIPIIRRLNAALDCENKADKVRKRTGRPRKGETDKEQLVIADLMKHHGYQNGGSVSNPMPAKTAQLAKLASGKQVKVSVATVSRFFAKKFPERGYKGYKNACVRGEIGMKLALWQGELPGRLADLLPEECGRGEDD